jgi:hypothetical protein
MCLSAESDSLDENYDQLLELVAASSTATIVADSTPFRKTTQAKQASESTSKRRKLTVDSCAEELHQIEFPESDPMESWDRLCTINSDT